MMWDGEFWFKFFLLCVMLSLVIDSFAFVLFIVRVVHQ